MSSRSEFVAHVQDLLTPLGPLTSGRLFGGHGFKCGGRQFAMIMGDTLYLRVDDTTRLAHERHGMAPFSYATRKGLVLVRTYSAVPAEWLEDRDQLLAAASRALSVAGA